MQKNENPWSKSRPNGRSWHWIIDLQDKAYEVGTQKPKKLRPPEVLNEWKDEKNRTIVTTNYLYRMSSSRFASVFDVTIQFFWFTIYKASMKDSACHFERIRPSRRLCLIFRNKFVFLFTVRSELLWTP